MLTCVRIPFTDLNAVNQPNHQLPGNGFQLEKLPCPLHQVSLLLGIFSLGQFLVNCTKPPLQAAFFVQKGLVQLHKLVLADNTRYLV